MRAGLTTGGAEAPAMGRRGRGRLVRGLPLGSEERTLGARLGHVRFAPIYAVPAARRGSRKQTFVQEAGSGCSRAFSDDADSAAGRL
jgi:hypothetical protein